MKNFIIGNHSFCIPVLYIFDIFHYANDDFFIKISQKKFLYSQHSFSQEQNIAFSLLLVQLFENCDGLCKNKCMCPAPGWFQWKEILAVNRLGTSDINTFWNWQNAMKICCSFPRWPPSWIPVTSTWRAIQIFLQEGYCCLEGIELKCNTIHINVST